MRGELARILIKAETQALYNSFCFLNKHFKKIGKNCQHCLNSYTNEIKKFFCKKFIYTTLSIFCLTPIKNLYTQYIYEQN